MVRILVLEDDLELQSMLAQVLSEQGFQVAVASSGEQALQLAKEQEFELVVADVRLQGMDGLETLAQMRQSQPEVHSLIVSGYASEEQTLRALQLGVGGYLKKPFKLQEFLAQVQRLASGLQARQKQQEHDLQLRALLRWVCEATTRARDCPRVLRAESQALRLAARAGLAGDLHVAALLAALESSGAGSPPSQLMSSKSMRRALHHYGEHWDGSGPQRLSGEQIPLEARLVACALYQAGFPAQENWLDPAWLQPGEEPEEDESEAPRGLLALARALERAGDATNADAAYQEIFRRSPHSPEGAAALSGAARLAQRGGQVEQARLLVERSTQAAAAQGPRLHACGLLEGGLMLESAEMLSQAESLFRQLELPGWWAASRLAQADLWSKESDRDHCLQLLGSFEHAAELAQSAVWLLPRLLRAQPSASVDRILRRLLLECPEEAYPCLGGQLDLPLRLRLAHLLAGTPLAEALNQDAHPEVSQALQQPAAPAAPLLLRVYSLGSFEIYVGEQKLPANAFRTQKTRYLLAYLVGCESPEIPEERVLDLFWEGDLSRGRQSLNNALYSLRKTLGGDFFARQRGNLVRSEACWHDLREFEKACAEGALARGVRLYKGVYLDTCYMDWANERRRASEQMLQTALTRLLEEAHQQQQHRLVEEYAQRLISLDPCRQDAHLCLMQSYLTQNQPQLAIRQYESCLKSLSDEMDMQPSLQHFELYQRARLMC